MSSIWNLVETNIKNNKLRKEFFSGVKSNKVISESVTRLNPYYLAKYNPVMFTVELDSSWFYLLHSFQAYQANLWAKIKYFILSPLPS